MIRNSIYALVLAVLAIPFISGAQSRLTGEEWKAFLRAESRYDSLQAEIQKMFENDPELQKNPNLIQQKLGEQQKQINEIYEGLSTTAAAAIRTIEGDLDEYGLEDLRHIKVAATASRTLERVVGANKRMIELIENRDSTLVLKMELVKAYAYMDQYDEAANYATADVLTKGNDEDKIQVYSLLSSGYAQAENFDKAMLYAFKAIEALNAYYNRVSLQYASAPEEQLDMIQRQFANQYAAVLFEVAYTMKNDETKKSFIDEAQKAVANDVLWGHTATTLETRIQAQKMEDARLEKPAPVWAEHAWVNGEPLSLEKLKGKVVLIDFFATWCKPCIMAFPHVKEWQEKYEDQGLVIAGLTNYQGRYKGKSVSAEDELAKMRDDFIKEHGITWTVGIEKEGNDTFSDYGVRGIPFVVLIDKQGRIRYQKSGAGDYEQTEKMIKKLLKEDA